MKNCQSPEHALASQIEAMAQLVDALKNAAEHEVGLKIEYVPNPFNYGQATKAVIEAHTALMCRGHDVGEIVPEITEWDVTSLLSQDSRSGFVILLDRKDI